MESRRRNSRPGLSPWRPLTKGPALADPCQSRLENPVADSALPATATHQSLEHTYHIECLLSLF